MTSVLILYHSQEHGNTRMMAKAVAKGARQAGAAITLINTNEQRFDIEKYRAYDAVAFGSPDYYSYIAGGLKTFLDDWYLHRNESGYTGKPFVLFMSHGGGGRAKASLSVFSRLGTQIGDIVSSSGSPSSHVLEQCKALRENLARS